ncbi:cellulase family glycosylhydrolase [Streptomyces abyssomicinicus]|uniref:cellulase family glycosylhydrolase n=1 Tax=Streptomyces abyssomicinicus TaxID=574929 RepID=UPI001FEB5CAB|nr:cellulase family glycosylhydrolase [Streptomyces abyssomicinicus]
MRTARVAGRRPFAAVIAALATLVGLLALSAAPAQAAPAGLRVTDGRVVEGNGNDFVMRGVNHAHTWYQSETQSFADIKALGANTVRVVLADGHRWTANSATDVAAVVDRCKANKLICVLEVHDTTGYGEESAAGTLDQAANYWIGLKDVLAGQEDYVVINIGNEPYGNNNAAAWTDATKNAIVKLRGAGFRHALMVDAPNWGQDWSGTMRDNAVSVFAADPDRNTIFSIHMYGVYDTAAEVQSYLNHFVTNKLPIVVGEFGNDHSDGNPDEDAIMATAQSLGIGYIGWSWSGNGGGVEYLDMVNGFDAGSLSTWGTRFFKGANGIAQTSREATVYSGSSGGDTQAPTAPGTPRSSAVTSASATLTWTASTDNVGVTGYEVVRVNGSSQTVVATSGTTSATVTGLSASTAYTFAVRARDAAGNRSPNSATVQVTTSPGGGTPSGSCAVGYKVVNQWSGGFQGEIVLRNTATTPVSNWKLAFTYADGQQISNMWGGTATQSGTAVTVTPASYTSTIPAGGSVTLGFLAGKGAANTAPAQFTLDGAVCAAL